MIRSVYHFHVYYQVRQVLKRLQTPLPHETGFNTADNPYTESKFLKICEDYRVPHNPMRYRDEKFYWTISMAFIGPMIIKCFGFSAGTSLLTGLNNLKLAMSRMMAITLYSAEE